jgi:glycosyltransferase involved in cell wall biosynthesis
MSLGDSRPHVLMCWFNDDWGRFGRTYENVARGLAKDSRVARVVCLLPAAWTAQRNWQWPLVLREHHAKLTAVTLRTHCAPGNLRPHRARRLLNRDLIDGMPRLIARVFGFDASNTLLWLFPPHQLAARLDASIRRRFTVTHIIDNNTLLTSRDETKRNWVDSQYRQTAQAADLVYVNSQLNLDYFSKLNPSTLLFSNAVDPAFFGKPRRAGSSINVGYLGWISERTDVSILEHIARAKPEWQIHIAAPETPEATSRLSTLSGLANVLWQKDVDQSAAPAFLAKLDVCVMPHVDNPYSRSMNPLKLFQYLASGRPVVTTKVAGTEPFAEHLTFAETGADFVATIEDLLKRDTLEMAQRRIDAVAGETWDVRVRSMLDPILERWQASSNSLPVTLRSNC